jgi:predicted transcriptional regulator
MIACGEKTYELRRRPPPDAAVGRTALIYSTAPESRIICGCKIVQIIRGPIEELWDHVAEQAGCSRAEYLGYFQGMAIASAIQLRVLPHVGIELTRQQLRDDHDFVPPQSWRWANELEKSIAAE